MSRRIRVTGETESNLLKEALDNESFKATMLVAAILKRITYIGSRRRIANIALRLANQEDPGQS